MFAQLFPKTAGPFGGCPCNESPTMWGSVLGPLIFGNSHKPCSIYHIPYAM